jgi:hypothetical protein
MHDAVNAGNIVDMIKSFEPARRLRSKTKFLNVGAWKKTFGDVEFNIQARITKSIPAIEHVAALPGGADGVCGFCSVTREQHVRPIREDVCPLFPPPPLPQRTEESPPSCFGLTLLCAFVGIAKPSIRRLWLVTLFFEAKKVLPKIVVVKEEVVHNDKRQ